MRPPLRLKVSSLLLTILLLTIGSSQASACFFLPLLDPFHWLFGCTHGYGHGYGYNPGYGYGGGPGLWGSPQMQRRFIDDWFGYGYLRNQQWTLGHYPGRPFACYQPSYPQVCSPYAPAAPAPGMPCPMVAPLPVPVPAQMPAYQDPCCDPCPSPCCDPCQQMFQQPMPVTTWRPMTVDRGYWTQVWVPRPVTTMVPQMQYMTPAPMYQSPMIDSGCDSCSGMGGGMEMMPQGTMIPQTSMSGADDSGCCGSDGGMAMTYDGGMMGSYPQSAMLMPGGMGGYGMPASSMPYSSMSQWYMDPMYSGVPVLTARQMRHARRHARRMSSPGYLRRHAVYPPMMGVPQPYGWGPSAGYAPGWNTSSAWPAAGSSGYAWSEPSGQWQTAAVPSYPMPGPQWQSMPSPQWQPMPMLQPEMVAGDLMGDHEMPPAAAAAIPVTPNAYSGGNFLAPAVWSNPFRPSSAAKYHNVVR